MRFVRLAAPIAIAAACHAATFAALPSLAFAQQAKTSASSLIQRGSELFDDASYEESIQTLSAALLRPGTSKAEKIEIYRLLAYNYITLKRSEEADAAVRGLLVLDEDFSLPPTESPRFRDFFKATREKWEAEGKPGLSEAASPTEKLIKIMHASPAQVAPGTTIKLSGHIEDPDGKVRGVQLAYRTGAEGKFVLASATYTLGDFRAQIPGNAVKPPLIEYYLQAVDNGGLPLSSRGDAATPLRIAVPEKKGGVLSSPWFWVPVGLAVVGGGVATAFILANRSSSPPTSTVTINVRE